MEASATNEVVQISFNWVSAPAMLLAIFVACLSRIRYGNLNKVISDGSNAAAAYLLFFMLGITAAPVFGLDMGVSIDEMIKRDRILMALAFVHSALSCSGNVVAVISGLVRGK